jgi:hypothetical protein
VLPGALSPPAPLSQNYLGEGGGKSFRRMRIGLVFMTGRAPRCHSEGAASLSRSKRGKPGGDRGI